MPLDPNIYNKLSSRTPLDTLATNINSLASLRDKRDEQAKFDAKEAAAQQEKKDAQMEKHARELSYRTASLLQSGMTHEQVADQMRIEGKQRGFDDDHINRALEPLTIAASTGDRDNVSRYYLQDAFPQESGKQQLEAMYRKTEKADEGTPVEIVSNGRAVKIMSKSGRVIGDSPVKATAPSGVKLSPTAQKELFESDDTVQASKNVQVLLTQALALNKKSYSGIGAKTGAVIASNIPFMNAPEGADATINLDNLMTGQALESLKSVFGGMPTEGERKILLELQASADKTPKQREDIITRAIDAAKRREKFNADRSKSLRAGTYFSENPATDTNDSEWSDL